MVMKVCLKCADIGHSSKARKLHATWSGMIIEEFFSQGDCERELGYPISPFMNRESENSAKNQVGFFEFIVLPFYETVAEVIFDDTFIPILHQTRTNYHLWKLAVNMELSKIGDIKKDVFYNEAVTASSKGTQKS